MGIRNEAFTNDLPHDALSLPLMGIRNMPYVEYQAGRWYDSLPLMGIRNGVRDIALVNVLVLITPHGD